eukprot:TRINITY_DN17713_c0_g1_i1.p1 TRINITY_DN17713_c0_g1~~TRINITY_DN17713_c0_g1_i1.p1  ORF type:complete len:1567 (+),score=623.57 TRINITY_DN17713_c0_g1_i1:37-4737(+)
MDEIRVGGTGGNGMEGVSELPPEEEESFSGPLGDRLRHKNWKARKAAAEELKALFEAKSAEAQEHIHAIPALVKDANASAMEAGLECCVAYLTTLNSITDTKQILTPVLEKGVAGRPKTLLNSQEVLSLVTELGNASDVIEAFDSVIAKAKAAKHKQALASTLLLLFSSFGASPFDLKQCIPTLTKLVSETDEKTRKAARQVIVYFYQMNGPAVVSIMESKGVKASTVAEIKKECEGAEPLPAPTRLVKGAEAPPVPVAGGAPAGGAMSAEDDSLLYDAADPEPVLKYLPKEFYTVVPDHKAKWGVKKEMVETNLMPHITKVKLQQDDYSELCKTLKRALTDPNIAMTALVVRAFLYLCKGLRQNFAREGRLLFPVFLDLMKEKKITVAEPLRDVLFAMYDHGIIKVEEVNDDLVKASTDKVILVRMGLVQWMERCVLSSASKAAKAMKVFAPVAVSVLNNDQDSGVKEQAAKVCSAFVKQCGADNCAFVADLPQKTQDKILKGKSSDGASTARKPNTARGARPGAAAPAAAPAEESAPKSARQPLKGGAPKVTKLNTSAAKIEAPKADDAPPPFSRSDAEGMLETLVPAAAPALIAGLSAKTGKERQTALQDFAAALGSVTDVQQTLEVVASLFYTATPGWKDSSFQAVVEMLKILDELSKKVDMIPPRVVKALAPAVEKLQDMKIKKPLRDYLSVLCEGTSPRLVVNNVLNVLTNAKSPKAIQEGLEWIAETLLEFGSGTCDEKAVISYAIKCLEMSTPAIKGASLKVFSALARCCGAQTVLRIAKGTDLRPALLKQIEEECDKVKDSAPVVPLRTAKGAPVKQAEGGLDEPKDIRSLIDSALLEKLSSSNWSSREEALLDISKIVNRKVKPDVGHDLIPALKQRLGDTNKKIIPVTCNVISELFEGIGPACKMHAQKIIPTVLQLLGDQKPQVRAGARKVLSSYDKMCGLDGILPFLPKAMATDVPSARQELSEFLVDVLNRDAKNVSLNSLKPTVQPLIDFLQDRHPATRKLAEEMLRPVIENVGFDTVAKHVGDLGPANQRALQPILDKNRQFDRSQQPPTKVVAKKPLGKAPLSARSEGKELPSDSEPPLQKPRITYEQVPKAEMEEPQGAYKPKQVFKAMTKDAGAVHHTDPADLPSKTPAMPRQQTQIVITSIPMAIELLTHQDIEMCLRAAEKIQLHEGPIPIDEVMLKSMTKLTYLCTDVNTALDVRGCRGLVSFMTEIFVPPVSQQCKTETMFYLIGALLDNLLTEKLHSTYKDRATTATEQERRDCDTTLRCLNSLMLKLLERSGRTETFCALIKRLDMYNRLIYNESSRYVQYVELVAKCLLKLIRFVTQENAAVDFTKLLSAVHEFLTENPPTNFKGKMELPLRTVKTLLNELVKVKGEMILECLNILKIPENALIAEFINMCLNKTQDDVAPTHPQVAQQVQEPVAPVQPVQTVTVQQQMRPAVQATGRGGVAPEIASQMDVIFSRVRKTDTSREGVAELYALMQANPTLDISPWLSECSVPFQAFLQRQLAAHAAHQAPSSTAQQKSAAAHESMAAIRERMAKMRQSKGK